MSNKQSFIGLKVSIISKTGLRFEGIIDSIDDEKLKLTLKDCMLNKY